MVEGGEEEDRCVDDGLGVVLSAEGEEDGADVGDVAEGEEDHAGEDVGLAEDEGVVGAVEAPESCVAVAGREDESTGDVLSAAAPEAAATFHAGGGRDLDFDPGRAGSHAGAGVEADLDLVAGEGAGAVLVEAEGSKAEVPCAGLWVWDVDGVLVGGVGEGVWEGLGAVLEDAAACLVDGGVVSWG